MPGFSPQAIKQCNLLRNQLHMHPELSGNEAETANTIVESISALNPDQIITNIGGHGVAFKFNGIQPGPRVLFRCELDALPIVETNSFTHASIITGVSHKCGHDGHMAILYLLAGWLSDNPPASGQVILLFQPAEETGQGAAAVVADDRYKQIQADYAFALHNLPGYPKAQVLIKSGSLNCASRGMSIKLKGITAHAAQPETGISPASTISQIIAGFGIIKDTLAITDELVFVTVVYASLGERAYGVAPGDGEVMVTLRSETDKTMSRLVEYSENWISGLCQQADLAVRFDYADNFAANVNSHEAAQLVKQAAEDLQLDLVEVERPFRWSEDFGEISATCKGAMFGLGAGEATPQLHNPDYDFPGQLIVPGASMFVRLIEILLNQGASDVPQTPDLLDGEY